MSIDTDKMRELLNKLDEARKRLEDVLQAREHLNLTGHHHDVGVKIGNRVFDISHKTYGSDWNSTIIRGREMMLLGAQKAMNAEIDRCSEVVKDLERQIMTVHKKGMREVSNESRKY